MTHDDAGNPREIVGSWADVSDRKRVEAELQRLAEQVELRNKFIRETFGNYLTDEVVSTVLESPAGLQTGGEKRKITMMMTAIRGAVAAGAWLSWSCSRRSLGVKMELLVSTRKRRSVPSIQAAG